MGCGLATVLPLPRPLGFSDTASILVVLRVDARLGAFDAVDRLPLRFRLSGWVDEEPLRLSESPVAFSTLVGSVDGDWTGQLCIEVEGDGHCVEES